MASLLGGIKWILGREPGDATPNPELSAGEEKSKGCFRGHSIDSQQLDDVVVLISPEREFVRRL